MNLPYETADTAETVGEAAGSLDVTFNDPKSNKTVVKGANFTLRRKKLHARDVQGPQWRIGLIMLAFPAPHPSICHHSYICHFAAQNSGSFSRCSVARLTYPSRVSSDKCMNTNEIERFIPHRKPMLLVDEIVSRTNDKIVCRKTFHEDDFFVQGHFPDQPIVPGVIQCECCLQAGAILLSADTMQDAEHREIDPQADSTQPDTDTPVAEGRVPVATRMDAVKFKRMVRPGDTVEIQVVLKEQVSNAYYLTGKMLLDGKLAARLDFACSIANPGPTTAEKST